MKERTLALRSLTEIITILAEIIRDLDPGRVNQYDRIADLLEKARAHITRAEAFER